MKYPQKILKKKKSKMLLIHRERSGDKTGKYGHIEA